MALISERGNRGTTIGAHNYFLMVINVAIVIDSYCYCLEVSIIDEDCRSQCFCYMCVDAIESS